MNTVGGWREIRLSSFAKRPAGTPVTNPYGWDAQRLYRVDAAATRTKAALALR